MQLEYPGRMSLCPALPSIPEPDPQAFRIRIVSKTIPSTARVTAAEGSAGEYPDHEPSLYNSRVARRDAIHRIRK